jgi:hypothetical protein
MADVILDTEDLLVLGGPREISVDVDFGPRGQRGSLIFSVAGNPNLVPEQIPTTPLPYDLAVNILPSDPRYLVLYQYVSRDGVESWVETAQVLPNAGALKFPATFEDGEVTITVDVSAITTSPLVTPLNFGIIHSIQQVINNYPISSSFTIASEFVDVDGKDHLSMTFKAIEFNGTDWQPLEGLRGLSVFITVV